MSNVFGIKIEGVNEVDRQFNSLSIQIQKNIVKKSFRKASRPIITQSRQNLKAAQASNSTKRHFYDLTGNTSKSLGLRVFKSGLGMIIGARVTGGFKGYLAHIIDRGTVQRKANGKNRGKINASNFFSTVTQQQQQTIINDVTNQIQTLFN